MCCLAKICSIKSAQRYQFFIFIAKSACFFASSHHDSFFYRNIRWGGEAVHFIDNYVG